MNLASRSKSASERRSGTSQSEPGSHSVLVRQQVRWPRVLSSLALAGTLVALCLPTTACNLCGSSCSTSISCTGQVESACAASSGYGCAWSAPSCLCVNAQCAASTSEQCAALTETQCPSSGLCAWMGHCYRPVECEKIQNDEDRCVANGCSPHDECD